MGTKKTLTSPTELDNKMLEDLRAFWPKLFASDLNPEIKKQLRRRLRRLTIDVAEFLEDIEAIEETRKERERGEPPIPFEDFIGSFERRALPRRT